MPAAVQALRRVATRRRWLFAAGALAACASLATLAPAPDAADATCPPEASPRLRNVPRLLRWGNRATIETVEPISAEIVEQAVAWADTGRVFAEADEPFDFWIEAQYPDRSFGFVLTWTARYFDDAGLEQTCSGRLGPFTIRSGLDTRLRINHSLAAIRLEQPERRVRFVLGPPSRIVTRYRDLRIFRYTRWNLEVWLFRGRTGWRVQSVRTGSRLFRTDRGVGVGTPFAVLRRTHGGFQCFLGQSAFQLCLKRQLAPLPTTMFEGSRGRITRSVITLMGD